MKWLDVPFSLSCLSYESLTMHQKLAIIAGLLGAGCLSQFPEFVQQYTQRVGGAQAELRTVVEDFRSDAAKYGLTEQQAVERFRASADGFLVERGTSMQQTLQRFAFLSNHYAALRERISFAPLVAFVKTRDYQIAKEAWTDFRPAIPMTQEGAAHSIIGFLGGWLPVQMFGTLIVMLGLGGRRQRRYEPVVD
jgi:hypothetical protein